MIFLGERPLKGWMNFQTEGTVIEGSFSTGICRLGVLVLLLWRPDYK